MLVQTLEQEHCGELAECRAQLEDMQGNVAELRSEAPADVVSLSNSCLYQGAHVQQSS